MFRTTNFRRYIIGATTWQGHFVFLHVKSRLSVILKIQSPSVSGKIQTTRCWQYGQLQDSLLAICTLQEQVSFSSMYH